MDAFDHIIPEGECCKSPISLKSQSTRSSTFHDSLSSHTSCTLSEDNVFDSKNNRGKPCSPTAEGPESLCPSLPLSESLSQRFLIQGRRDSAYWNIRSSGRNKDEALLASLRWVPEKERDEIIMRDADGRIRAVVRNDGYTNNSSFLPAERMKPTFLLSLHQHIRNPKGLVVFDLGSPTEGNNLFPYESFYHFQLFKSDLARTVAITFP